jgi:hypothetical protein
MTLNATLETLTFRRTGDVYHLTFGEEIYFDLAACCQISDVCAFSAEFL